MPKPSAQPSARYITRQAWSKWMQLKLKLLLIAVIAIAINVVLIAVTILIAYVPLMSQVWFLAVLTTIIWLVSHSNGRKKTPRIREAFYEGTASIVRQVLVFLIWVAYMIPFLVGLFLAWQASLNPIRYTDTEIMGFKVLWLLLALLSFYWILRAWLAPLYVSDGQTPIEAIKTSWAFSRKRIGWVFRVLLLSIVVAVLPMAAASALTFLPLAGSEWFGFAISAITIFIGYAFTMPFMVTAAVELKKYYGSKKRFQRQK